MSRSIHSSISELFLTAICVISCSPTFCTAWNIAADCSGFPEVSTQMTSALNMAIYASKRAGGDPPILGSAVVDLLGAPDENDPATLALARTWFDNVIAAAKVPSSGGIIIHCTDSFLTTINPATRKYVDNTRGNQQVNAPPPPAGIIPTDNACGGFAKAFTYSAGIQQVVILCSDSPKGALNSAFKTSLDAFRELGNLKNERIVMEKGLDALGTWLSSMILHELMHAASFAQQLILPQPGQFPAVLPDPVNGERIGEIYQYSPISGKQLGDPTSSGQPSANNLQHNADSFALLAASWFLPPYAWVNGQCKSIKKANQAPLVYDDTDLPPGPS